MTTLQDYAATGVPSRQLGRTFREWNQNDIDTILSYFGVHHQNRRSERGRNKLEMLRKLHRVTKEHKLTEADAQSILSGRGLDRPVSDIPTPVISKTSRSYPPQDNAPYGRLNRGSTISDSTTSTNSNHAFERTHKTSNERECAICLESLPLLDFPVRDITSSCNHEPNICASCLSKSIATQFTTKAWNIIDCPTCSQRLDYADVMNFADNATFEKCVSTPLHLPWV